MNEIEIKLRQDITKAIKKGWITKGGFMTDVAVDEVYKMMKGKNNVALHNVVGSNPSVYEKNDLPIDVRISFNKAVDAYQQIKNYEMSIIGRTDFIKEIRDIEHRYNYEDLK